MLTLRQIFKTVYLIFFTNVTDKLLLIQASLEHHQRAEESAALSSHNSSFSTSPSIDNLSLSHIWLSSDRIDVSISDDQCKCMLADINRQFDLASTIYSAISQPGNQPPQQQNGYNCGVFVITAMDYLADDLPLCYDQNDVDNNREKIAAAIHRGSLAH